MEELERPRREKPALLICWMLAVSAAICTGEPMPRWLVTFPNTKAGDSVAVPVENGGLLVSVMPSGTDARNAALSLGERRIPANFIGHDPVSRLGFLKMDSSLATKSADWLAEAGGSANGTLQAGTLKCRSTGWVKQVGGKILPLALLRVNFDGPVPQRGTPLTDASGKVAAIVFQETGSGNSGYAIPAEAVHRVRRDLGTGGPLVRGWLGLSLRAENPAPQIVRVLAGSPALSAGIKPGDILVQVGERRITDYADAVNSFFYLIPGQPVAVKLVRGADSHTFTLTPTRPQAE